MTYVWFVNDPMNVLYHHITQLYSFPNLALQTQHDQVSVALKVQSSLVPKPPSTLQEERGVW